MDAKSGEIELAVRELERRHAAERADLVAFMRYMFEHEKGKPFLDNWHYRVIADALKDVLEGRCNRLKINVPPGSGKTEEITRCFPVWAMGHRPDLQVIATGYSATLTQGYGSDARDYYCSESYRDIFPRAAALRDDTNAKGFWKNDKGGSYYATGAGGAITGNRAHIFIIDDPLKPNEAESDVKREAINAWFDNTVASRLFDPIKDAIIIIMQRTHERDLCGYLDEKQESKTGETWRNIVLPAIAEKTDDWRKEGEPLQKNRYQLEALEMLRKSLGPVNFSTQYQQDPVNKESREFQEEWFRYYDETPVLTGYRIFTAVDPAFSKSDAADDSAIVTVAFKQDECIILEATAGKFDPGQLENEIIRHCKVWRPEKVGVEAIQAQQVIAYSLRARMQKEGINATIQEIRTTTQKEMRIRKLIPMYARGLIKHRRGASWLEKLEKQLLKFPRGAHDDLPDALQYAMELYTLQPSAKNNFAVPQVKFDTMGRPIY